MENKGVNCDVCECIHNVGCNKCDVETIDVTKQAQQEMIDTPHFCKTYEEK